MIVEIPLNRKTFAIAGALVGAFVLLLVWTRRSPRYIPADEVMAVVRSEAAAHRLDPAFVYAIVMAESSRNAHATSSSARGIMQLTRDTWAETTRRPYREAYDWRVCIAVGTARLGHLRDRLEARSQFSYARLAAAYRYGFGALVQRKFDVARLPRTRNEIYRQLFREEIPDPTRYGVSGPS